MLYNPWLAYLLFCSVMKWITLHDYKAVITSWQVGVDEYLFNTTRQLFAQ